MTSELLWHPRPFMGGVNGPNYASLPLEIPQHLQQVLPQGPHWKRPKRGLLSSGRLRCSTAGDASSRTDSRERGGTHPGTT